MQERYSFRTKILEALEVRQPARKIDGKAPIHLCKGYQHTFPPMKRGKTEWIPDGPETSLTPLNPGFLEPTGDLKPTTSLQTALKDLLTDPRGDFKEYLTDKSRRSASGDKIRVALVDLTGEKLLNPGLGEVGVDCACQWSECGESRSTVCGISVA